MRAAVFPGQGSQKPGMGRSLVEAFAVAKETFDRIADATGLDIAKVCFELDEETLRQTQNAQIALYACGMAAFLAFRDALPAASFDAAAGHSVGEYAALAAAGVVSIEDGAKLVQRRGDLMSRSGQLRPGTMAAVLGLEREALEAACRKASTDDEVAVIANDNCPGQLVISGDRAAVARAGELAQGAGAKRVLPLNVSGAFHSPLMAQAAESMGLALRKATFQAGEMPVFANVTASREADPMAWPGLLESQLKSPVRWTESVQAMRSEGVHTFVEFGGGEVLGGLIRRIDREATCLAVQDAESLAAAREALAGGNA